MKKIILKSTLAVVAVAASCLGAWKTYDAYGSVDNSLLMQNIEALSGNANGDADSGDTNGEGGGDNEMVCLKGDPFQICWKRKVVENIRCDYQNCRIITESWDNSRSKVCYHSAGVCTRKYAREHNLETMYFSDQKCTYPDSDVTDLEHSLHGQEIEHHTINHQ